VWDGKKIYKCQNEFKYHIWPASQPILSLASELIRLKTVVSGLFRNGLWETWNRLFRSFHNSTESLKFSYCTGWTYYGRNLNDLTNQYTFNVDNPGVIAICWSPLVISFYTKIFPFKQKSSPLSKNLWLNRL
jgi:hypothetical protein